jgi:UTP-glucose-1-phosphate uridylyltransferase
MAEEGKQVYGCEIKGDWLECGNKALWFRSFLTLLLKHPEYDEGIKQFLRDYKI